MVINGSLTMTESRRVAGRQSLAGDQRSDRLNDVDPEAAREGWFAGQRGAWIGAGGAVAAALITALAVYLVGPDVIPDASPHSGDKSPSPGPTSAGPSQAPGGVSPSQRRDSFGPVANLLVKNAASGMCADLPYYGNGGDGGQINQYPCQLGDTDNQVWSLGVSADLKGPGGAPLFTIRNVKDKLCMDLIYRDGQPAGTKLREGNCDPTTDDNQLWYRTQTSSGQYRIHNYASNDLCLGATERSNEQDAQLEIHDCGDGDDWSFPSGLTRTNAGG